jgi:hypothetical protein
MKKSQLFLTIPRHWGVPVLAVLMGMLLVGATAVTAQPAAAQSSSSGLTAAEIASLQYMREEEKLAHDVYITLAEQWGYPLFSNIAAAEQTHTNAILQLLSQYGLADPAAGNGVGVFTNADLQTLYNQLIAQGSQSLGAALLVGGLIEETDILDLQASIAETSKADIQWVYQNLLAGSKNHLRAFASVYEQVTGSTYTPQVMDPATFAAIMSEGNSSGNGNSNGRRGGGNNGSGGWGGNGSGNGNSGGGFGRNGR